MEPIGDAASLSRSVYLVAMVFILFDVEAIFLFPGRTSSQFAVVRLREMMIYIAVLLVGYLYLWKKAR